MVSERQHCQDDDDDDDDARVSCKEMLLEMVGYWVTNKTKFFVVAWVVGGILMFLSIFSNVETIKIRNKIDTAKPMV